MPAEGKGKPSWGIATSIPLPYSIGCNVEVRTLVQVKCLFITKVMGTFIGMSEAATFEVRTQPLLYLGTCVQNCAVGLIWCDVKRFRTSSPV